jgi:hydrogenase expression/formation protein HypC
MQLIERSEWDGTAELRGVQRQVSLMLCPEAQVGEHVLVHAGYAIATVDAEEARKTLELLDEIVQEDIPE